MMSREQIIKLLEDAKRRYIWADDDALKWLKVMKSSTRVYEIREALRRYDGCIEYREKWAKDIFIYTCILGNDEVDLKEINERAMRKD
jgi:hypothetical protein